MPPPSVALPGSLLPAESGVPAAAAGSPPTVSNSGAGERERGPDGRARNARPRDGLGRPLPRGAEGVERIPDDLVLPAAESLAEAQRLLDADRPFHAHEVLEGTWKAAPPGERDLWQGLAQLAVGLTHALRGNRAGAATLLRRGRERLAPYAQPPHGRPPNAQPAHAPPSHAPPPSGTAPPHGVDVDGLLAWADAAVARLGDPEAGPPDRPVLRRA